MEIIITRGSILDVEVEVIVNAANGEGWMGGGVAGAIKRAAGVEVEKEAVAHAPTAVGEAILTSPGRTKFKGIIHAPTMEQPAMRIPVANVGLATRAALALADQEGFTSVALPGMGTGVGGVSPAAAAKAMLQEVRAFRPQHLTKVVLVDIDPKMVDAWRKEFEAVRRA